MSTGISAEIEVDYGDERVAKSVAAAVSPDNLTAPEGMEISTRSEGGRVITSVQFRGRIQTLVATVDDLLSCMQAAENAVRPVRESRGRRKA